MKLKREGAPIYEKATINSTIRGHVPPGVTQVYVQFDVDALDGVGTFWRASHHDETFFLTGYLSNDEIAE